MGFTDPEEMDKAVAEFDSGIEAREVEGHVWTDEQKAAWMSEVANAWEVPLDQLQQIVAAR